MAEKGKIVHLRTETEISSAVPKKEQRARLVPEKKRKPLIRNKQSRIQPYRKIVQWGFLLLSIWMGVEFFIFVHQLRHGQVPGIERPPGVEAFLPISALVSLKYWITTGVLNHIHPASVILLLVIVALSLVIKRSFCSWVCPIGLISEYLGKLHRMIFDTSYRLPRFLDYPLRGIKYLILFYFVNAVFLQMNRFVMKLFIYSPYNRVADIKMLDFFVNMSATTFWILILLILFSILIPNFWCRYLCPYGALLGLTSFLSPVKIRRNPSVCIDCKKCTRVCPANINIHRASTVFSDECHSCVQCLDVCPVKEALIISPPVRKWHLNKKLIPYIIVVMFALGYIGARITGNWQNKISVQEYQYHVQHLENPEYTH